MSEDKWQKGDVEETDLLRVLGETTEALEGAGLPYMFIGGLPLAVYGRPTPVADLDVMVKHEDVGNALRALEEAGFDTKDTEMNWLHKAAREGVLVDLITRSEGDLFVDEEMLERTVQTEYKGHPVKLVSAEDLLVMKAIAHAEDTPHYWHDALTLIVGRDLDWGYVARRARHGTKRILSLLVYAQSTDLYVPDETIQDLYTAVYK